MTPTACVEVGSAAHWLPPYLPRGHVPRRSDDSPRRDRSDRRSYPSEGADFHDTVRTEKDGQGRMLRCTSSAACTASRSRQTLRRISRASITAGGFDSSLRANRSR